MGEGSEARGARCCENDARDRDLVRLDVAAAEPAGQRDRACTPARLQRSTWSGLAVQSSFSSRMESTLRTLGRLPDCVDPGRDTHRFTGERISDCLVQRHGVPLRPSFRPRVAVW